MNLKESLEKLHKEYLIYKSTNKFTKEAETLLREANTNFYNIFVYDPDFKKYRNRVEKDDIVSITNEIFCLHDFKKVKNEFEFVTVFTNAVRSNYLKQLRIMVSDHRLVGENIGVKDNANFSKVELECVKKERNTDLKEDFVRQVKRKYKEISDGDILSMFEILWDSSDIDDKFPKYSHNILFDIALIYKALHKFKLSEHLKK